MSRSAVAAVDGGSWREVSAGPLAVLATLAVAVDVLTTARILHSPEYREGNQFLVRIAELDPTLALVVFVGYCGLFLVVAWLSFGWLSPAIAGLLVVSMGGGAVNNLVLFATGTAAYPRIGLDHVLAVHLVQPLVGTVLGVALARRRDPLPRREVAAFAVGVVGIAGAVEVLF